MKRTITIDGKEITFVANGRTLPLYTQWIGEDILVIMPKIQNDTSMALDFFSKLAYVMARQADPEVGELDEWLDQFGVFSLYNALPQLEDMWAAENRTTVKPKKKVSGRKGS